MAKMGLSKIAIQETAQRLDVALRQLIAENKLSLYNKTIIKNGNPSRQVSPEDFVRFISVHTDPDFKGRYAKWIINRLIARDRELSDLWNDQNSATVIQTRLARFTLVKPFLELKFRDINYFKTVGELYDFLLMIEDANFKSIRQMDREKEEGLLNRQEAVIVHDDEQTKVIWVKTPMAATHFGRNTKWCITTPSGDNFYQYTLDSLLFIILLRGKESKFAYSAPRYNSEYGEFRDQTNTRWYASTFFDRHPEIFIKISDVVEQMGEVRTNRNNSSYGEFNTPSLADAITECGRKFMISLHNQFSDLITGDLIDAGVIPIVNYSPNETETLP